MAKICDSAVKVARTWIKLGAPSEYWIKNGCTEILDQQVTGTTERTTHLVSVQPQFREILSGSFRTSTLWISFPSWLRHLQPDDAWRTDTSELKRGRHSNMSEGSNQIWNGFLPPKIDTEGKPQQVVLCWIQNLKACHHDRTQSLFSKACLLRVLGSPSPMKLWSVADTSNKI